MSQRALPLGLSGSVLNVSESSHVAFYSVAFCSSAVKAENSRTLAMAIRQSR
jgi:hypothetical protein